MNDSDPALCVKTLTSICTKCRRRFEYQARVTPQGNPTNGIYRHVCDACRARRKRWLDLKRKRNVVAPIRKISGREERARPGEFTSRNRIADELGIHQSLVADIERSALHKLRSSPELAEAFRQYKRDGMPEIEQLARALKASGSELLLGYQLEVGDFWKVHDRLESEGLREEAQAVLENIIQCQRAIGRQLQAVEL
ncbi:MAG: hypothetical protein ABSE16_01705 [Verrucomicrobiota bacterium]|jgi:hypothetical protein